MSEILREHAESQFAEELAALQQADNRERPAHWALSPWAVVTYLMGGKLDNGFTISAKYIGNRRLMETAVSTLTTDRALLLFGVPGTAKSWVSEHLAAAISGDSTMLIQGTAGTSEEQLRYGWNYAQLLSKGPSKEALVPSPLMRAMELGKTARVEEPVSYTHLDVYKRQMQFSAQEVLKLSPDEASAKAAKGLVTSAKWPGLHHDDQAVWGECQGSGSKPYQVQVD